MDNMKGDDKEPLLENENQDSRLNVNNNFDLKDKTEKNCNDTSSFQPKYHYSQKGCIENKCTKYLICCFYNNYDFTFQEYSYYSQLKSSIGCAYDEKNPFHENLLEEFYIKLKSLSKELETSPNYQDSDKTNRSTSATNSYDIDKKYIDNLWKVIGFQVSNNLYIIFRLLIPELILEEEAYYH